MSAIATSERKKLGAFYTPNYVVRSLVQWAVRDESDLLLDPACGDGRFLAEHTRSYGVECDCAGVVAAVDRAPKATIHEGDFFVWAEETKTRFDCAVGNPPFIRYQHFAGKTRDKAFRVCARLGVKFSSLSSSWAPFLVVGASLLKPGGRMAFVVPAEIGHAPYAAPLLRYLCQNFEKVQLVAFRKKLFPELSEDVWLLYGAGHGQSTGHIVFCQKETFEFCHAPPSRGKKITIADWEKWNQRIRPFLLPKDTRDLYELLVKSRRTFRLKELARVGIGYVTGANDFFHLRPSQAKLLGIPENLLLPTVRNSRALTSTSVTKSTLKSRLERDEPILLLRINRYDSVPKSVGDYLDSPDGQRARTSYKCRNRKPWYVVPDVRIPHAFLSYMSGYGPQLVANTAGCTCTNSLHAVEMLNGCRVSELQEMWNHPLARFSCEVEGHPLGGGMLKLEPGEAGRILLPHDSLRLNAAVLTSFKEGIATMRKWRHYE